MKCHSANPINPHNIYKAKEFASIKEENFYEVSLKTGSGSHEDIQLLGENNFFNQYYPERGIITYPPVYREPSVTALQKVVLTFEEAYKILKRDVTIIPLFDFLEALLVIGIDPVQFGITAKKYTNNLIVLDPQFHTCFIVRISDKTSVADIRANLSKVESDCKGFILAAHKFIADKHLTIHGIIAALELCEEELKETLICDYCENVQHFCKDDFSDPDKLADRIEAIHESSEEDVESMEYLDQLEWFLNVTKLFLILKSSYQEGLPKIRESEGLPKIRGSVKEKVDSILFLPEQVDILNHPNKKKIIRGK